MKLGAVKYVVPFGFVLNPALVAQAGFVDVALALLASLVAVYAIACAIGGWLVGVERRISLPVRLLLGAGGFMLFLSDSALALPGLAVVVGVVAVAHLRRGQDQLTPSADQNPEDDTPRHGGPETFTEGAR